MRPSGHCQSLAKSVIQPPAPVSSVSLRCFTCTSNMAFDQCRFADSLAKYEAIWNVKAKDHGNKERRKAQIQALADECGISGEYPVSLCSTAWPPNIALPDTALGFAKVLAVCI